MLLKVDNNTIIIAKRKLLSKLIENLRKNTFLNLKFMTLDELRYNCTFKYDKKTIYYLMSKYKYNYDVAIKLLDNLYYVEDKKYRDNKLNNLVSLKQELLEEKLLYTNSLFIDNYKNYSIVIYNYGELSKYDSKFIKDLMKITKVKIVNDDKNIVNRNLIYEFNTIEEEVVYVAESISKLLSEGVSISKIKICGVNDEYKSVIRRIFKYYSLPINLNDSKLYGTKICKIFLDNLDSDINKTINILKDRVDFKNENNLEIYNSIVEIINAYAWCDNILDVRALLINDFKNTDIARDSFDRGVDVIESLDVVEEDDYIFLISFNQGIIPVTYRDEDYLSDKLKKVLKIDTSGDLNVLAKNKWFYDIQHCNNLTITYKKSDSVGECYLSSLNDYLNYDIKEDKVSYSNYSHLYNKIELTKKIDNLIKYNVHDETLDILYSNYRDINYLTYDNRYTGINNELFKKYLNNKISLSYTSIDNYYHCCFKYYLSNILKINKYEKTFYTIIGNLFHYILSICLDRDIDVRKEYYDYIKKEEYEFNAREMFFLDNLYVELVFIIDVIKRQNEYSSLDKSLYEDKIVVNKKKDNIDIEFVGKIDKLIMGDKEGVIIDYKTGSASIDLNNIIYGLSLQLPVYIYLVKNKYPDIRIIGFYLQKILNGKINIDNKHTYEELKSNNLKLQGYTSMYDEDIMKFDSGYSASKVIKGMRTSSKGISSKKIYDDDLIESIYNLVDDKIDRAIDNILDASFDINPKKIGVDNIGCKYCNYRDICFMKDRDIVNLKEYKDISFLKEKS